MCEDLEATVADGWARLDEVTKARFLEHAKTCEACAEEIDLAKDDDAFFEEGQKGETTRPEVKAKVLERIAREKTPRPFRVWPIGLALLLVAALGGAFYVLHRPVAIQPPEHVFTPDQGVELGTPEAMLEAAKLFHRQGNDAEARKALAKVTENPKASPELRDEARRLEAEWR
jgi:hypothetical protein